MQYLHPLESSIAAPNGGTQIARRVIDDLIEFSGQTLVDGYMSFFKAEKIAETRGFINRMREEANTSRNLIGQLTALIVEMEALKDQGEMFDTLMDLRDDREAANTKLQGLNALIAQAEEEIETKEAHIEAMNGSGALWEHIHSVVHCGEFDKGDQRHGIVKMFQFKFVKLWFVVCGEIVELAYWDCCRPFDFVDMITAYKLTEDAESLWLQDKMKFWFMHAQTKEHSFSVVIRDFCFELIGTLSQNRRLIAELEALGQRGDTLKALEGLREIVARDVVKLGVLEQLLAAMRVGIPLKARYVAAMEDKE
ncbi:hypothetical protein Tco_0442186 [Tanacetum coccineum]